MNKTGSIIWTSTEAAVVTGGKSTQDWCATGVSLNAAEIRPGDLYIASAEDDLEQVFHKGVAAVMVANSVNVAGDCPLLKVASVFEALQSLAAAGRYKTHATIVSVPSCSARRAIHNLLIKTSSVYEGGRHFSVGLAGLPDCVDYGLFGSSPVVRPDIAVISNCAATNSDALFEAMPAHGTVIIHADGDEFLSVMAQAKAAGIQNIFTYGTHALADAKICENLQAGSATRLSIEVLGEELSFVVPSELGSDPAFIAGLLILKLTGQKLSRVIKALEFSFPGGVSVTGDVALIDPAINREAHAVFRVKSMIDLGLGRQTAVLDGLVHSVHKAIGWPKKDLEIPSRFATIDFVHTSRRFSAVPNAHEAIKARYKNARIEEISAGVIAPGDFLVFKDMKKQRHAMFSEALRLILPNKPKRTRMKHAL